MADAAPAPPATPPPWSIEHGDALEFLAKLPAQSVDLVLTDPPSGVTAAPFDRPPNIHALVGYILERLTPSGIAVIMASDIRFASAILREAGPAFRYDLVWSKNLLSGFLNSRHRPLRAHEHILVLSPAARATYNLELTEGHIDRGRYNNMQASQSANYSVSGCRPVWDVGSKRFPTTLFDTPCVPNNAYSGRIHPQQKPVDLMRRLVRMYSPADPTTVVVDPFSGSGTVVLAAALEGRQAMGCDLDAGFVKASTERVRRELAQAQTPTPAAASKARKPRSPPKPSGNGTLPLL